MDLDSSLQAFTLDHARICGVNKTFSPGSFRPLGETKLKIKMEKRFRVTHQFNYSVVHNLIGKVNKHVALSISAILQTALHFTGKFPSSTAGLHLVLSTSCLTKKSHLVHNQRMVECFHAITIDAKHLSSTILFEK